MSTLDGALAVLLRQAQWMLDDLAHDIPAGRAGPDRRGREAAGILADLASLLRDSAAGTVIDRSGEPGPRDGPDN